MRDVTAESVDEFFTTVQNVLGQTGEHWYQGGAHDPENRRNVCIMAAQTRALKRMRLRSPWTFLSTVQHFGDQVALEQYPDRIDPKRIDDEEDDDGQPLAQLNDHPDTLFADIVAVTEKSRLLVLEKLGLS